MSQTFFRYNFLSRLTGHLCTSSCCTRYLHAGLICRYLKFMHRLSIWVQLWNSVSRVSNEKQSLARSTRVISDPNRLPIRKLVFSMDKSLEALHFGRTMSVKEKSPQSSLVYVSVFHLLQTQLHRHKSRLFKWDRIRTSISSGNLSSLPTYCWLE